MFRVNSKKFRRCRRCCGRQQHSFHKTNSNHSKSITGAVCFHPNERNTQFQRFRDRSIKWNYLLEQPVSFNENVNFTWVSFGCRMRVDFGLKNRHLATSWAQKWQRLLLLTVRFL